MRGFIDCDEDFKPTKTKTPNMEKDEGIIDKRVVENMSPDTFADRISAIDVDALETGSELTSEETVYEAREIKEGETPALSQDTLKSQKDEKLNTTAKPESIVPETKESKLEKVAEKPKIIIPVLKKVEDDENDEIGFTEDLSLDSILMECEKHNALQRQNTLPAESTDELQRMESMQLRTPIFKRTDSIEIIDNETRNIPKRSSSLLDDFIDHRKKFNFAEDHNPAEDKTYTEEDELKLRQSEEDKTAELRTIEINDENFEKIRQIAYDREEVRRSIRVIEERKGIKIKDVLRLNDKIGRIYAWKAEEAKSSYEPFKKHDKIPETVQSTNRYYYSIYTNWWGGEFKWRDKVNQVLNGVFHHKSLRLLQYPVINCILAGHNVLVLMPTGGGKSLCYQLPMLFKDGYTLVVSPLISLMQDQVKALNNIGIQAITCNSNSPQNMKLFEEDVRFNRRKYRVVYVAPELLDMSSNFISLMKQINEKGLFSYLVIDEVHCVSQWGHDFRESYVKLRDFRKKFPSVQTIMFTATATERVKNDVLISLGLEEALVFNQTFNRVNLTYQIKYKSSQDQCVTDIIQYIKEHAGQCGIVFCFSRKDCEKMDESLKSSKIKSEYYHAGMKAEERKSIQDGWMKGTYDVVCATVAFGMGIDKADVRFVIHQTMPSSVEQFFQESGRAGRDGKPSECIVYYSQVDVKKIIWLKSGGKPENIEKVVERSLNAMIDLCQNKKCRRVAQLNYFGEKFEEAECSGCDVCTMRKRNELRGRSGWGCTQIRSSKEERILQMMKGDSSKKKSGKGHFVVLDDDDDDVCDV
ncbi:ATP-dependent RNA helicase DBP3, putative [Entamoeba invadens IP1]|uniref:ATP-dependent DNA helicase n=1 Tax=Entamoeba invadens IP1 TaxID=370355 RepID=A0A0A1U7E1_ENTIV|nr:ATP-dependent RNA helicase DBP3, putative [Entamoeba invadens IP1]ELP90322.1 ATP-dependent RNA helicase DBP3, putative [Entamoeba invadens IP1]|eukprot:XP_004257093.1 ATP-dependent RNA helicase DBP3, putative [Entamoeba invadens IP1]